ncbi:MAG: hypothetical protein U0822_03135 [Anaerolineae bacterium]
MNRGDGPRLPVLGALGAVVGLVCFVVLLLAWPAPLPSLAQGDPGYDLTWWTIDAGGGKSSGGVYNLSGTLGQPEGGALSGGGYTLLGGFWPGVSAATPTSTTTPSFTPSPTQTPSPSATPTPFPAIQYHLFLPQLARGSNTNGRTPGSYH